MSDLLEYYPLILKLIGPSLHMKDRTRLRTLVSKTTTQNAKDYDERYQHDLECRTCLLQIIKCEGCDNWRKYNEVRWDECPCCYKDLCRYCANKVCNGCN